VRPPERTREIRRVVVTAAHTDVCDRQIGEFEGSSRARHAHVGDPAAERATRMFARQVVEIVGRITDIAGEALQREGLRKARPDGAEKFLQRCLRRVRLAFPDEGQHGVLQSPHVIESKPAAGGAVGVLHHALPPAAAFGRREVPFEERAERTRILGRNDRIAHRDDVHLTIFAQTARKRPGGRRDQRVRAQDARAAVRVIRTLAARDEQKHVVAGDDLRAGFVVRRRFAVDDRCGRNGIRPHDHDPSGGLHAP